MAEQQQLHEARIKSTQTIADYDQVAAAFDAGNATHDGAMTRWCAET